MVWRFKHYIGWLVGVIGFVLSLLVGFELINQYVVDQNVKGIIASIYAFSITGILLVAAAWREYQTIRKERYANITPYLHQAFHELRNIESYLELRSPAENASANEHEQHVSHIRAMLRDVLDRMVLVFVSLTSTYCRASIKLTYERNGHLYFYTLVRDKGSEQKLRELDRKRVRDNHDQMNGNRQFARLFSDEEECWHFISNDLTTEAGFTTTSMTAYNPSFAHSINPKGLWDRIRNNSWSLPYKSTIACAVRQGRFDQADNIDQVVLGFLTIDSESRGVFDERWDTQIMFALADALYHPLRRFVIAQNRAAAAGVDFSN